MVVYLARYMLPKSPSLAVLAAKVPLVGVYCVVTGVADDRLNSGLLPIVVSASRIAP